MDQHNEGVCTKVLRWWCQNTLAKIIALPIAFVFWWVVAQVCNLE